MIRPKPTDPAALERVQALLALALERVPPPYGEPPDLAAIAAWVEGELPPARAAEVAAFVARDPDCYRLWLDYADARALLDTESAGTAPPLLRRLTVWRGRLNAWWQTMGNRGSQLSGILAATAILLLLVSFVPSWFQDPLDRTLDRAYRAWIAAGQPPPQQWSSRLAGVTRGTRAIQDPGTDPERSAFLAGLANRVPELGTWPPRIGAHLHELPTAPLPCPANEKDCHQRQQRLRQLGEWILLLSLACADAERTGEWRTDFWAHQHPLLRDLRHRFEALACHSHYCTAIREALAADDLATLSPIAYCDLSETLLDHTYRSDLSD